MRYDRVRDTLGCRCAPTPRKRLVTNSDLFKLQWRTCQGQGQALTMATGLGERNEGNEGQIPINSQPIKPNLMVWHLKSPACTGREL